MNISRLCWAIGSRLQSMPKFHYAVRTGRRVGVYESWDKCKDQVNGYQGARYKKFGTAEEAWDFVNAKDDLNHNCHRDAQPARGRHEGKSYASSSNSTRPIKRAAQSKSYAVASMGSDHVCPLETTLAFAPVYVPLMVCMNKRKCEPATETDDCYLHPAKKTRCCSTDTASSCSSSSSSSSSSLSSSSSSSSREAGGNGRAVVYTDGACESNGRRGARAGVGVYWGDNNPYNTSERLEGRQTNQRAEIMAAIRAVQTAKTRNIKDVTLYTDSKYTMNAINSWIHRWKVNGWKTVSKKDVLNKEELQTLDSLCREVNVDWKYVPGHSNIKGNEEADSLAKAGARMHSS